MDSTDPERERRRKDVIRRLDNFLAPGEEINLGALQALLFGLDVILAQAKGTISQVPRVEVSRLEHVIAVKEKGPRGQHEAVAARDQCLRDLQAQGKTHKAKLAQCRRDHPEWFAGVERKKALDRIRRVCSPRKKAK
jgi:hypothetical protein